MTTDITRYGIGPRMSEAVAHNGTLYLAGQLGEPTGSVADQTRQALAAVDAILAKAGTDKTRILMVQIWLADMSTLIELMVAASGLYDCVPLPLSMSSNVTGWS